MKVAEMLQDSRTHKHIGLLGKERSLEIAQQLHLPFGENVKTYSTNLIQLIG
jgi:hypothetical protein